MTRLNITLLSILMISVGGHVGWHVRGIHEETRIDEEAHHRLVNFVVRGVERGLISFNLEVLHQDADTNMPPVAATTNSPGDTFEPSTETDDPADLAKG